MGQSLPEVPAPIPTMTMPAAELQRWSDLWEQLPAPSTADEPAGFESLGQNQGLMIYRTTIPPGARRKLSFANLHNYGLVLVNGSWIGTLGRRLGKGEIELPPCEKETVLEILVEGMGHINFTLAMDSDRKGIYGEVKLADAVLRG